MRKLFPATLLLICANLQADDYWCLDKHVSIRGDYGYIRRQEIRDLRLVEDTSVMQELNGNLKAKKVMDTEDLVDQFGWESAIRGGLTYHSSECASLEALYTYFYPWEGTRTVKADGTLQIPFEEFSIFSDYVNADRAEGKYKSQLQNGEFNYWGHLTPQRVNYFSFSWNLGFRAMYLREDLDLLFTKGSNQSLYSIDTYDILYGAQLGAVLEVNPTCHWTWSFMLKGAGFFNVARNEVCIRDENNEVTLREYTKRKWTDSWLLEAYGEIAYHWNSWLRFQFGYQGFILTGLVLAPEQRDVRATTSRRIKDKGQIVIDGMYAGLTLSF
ncbi:MAG: hypothetical protein K1000chlam2_00602 [Chlamydiae bacterium]|nr:hypothetical protein [Chlamydiota bacterium]